MQRSDMLTSLIPLMDERVTHHGALTQPDKLAYWAHFLNHSAPVGRLRMRGETSLPGVCSGNFDDRDAATKLTGMYSQSFQEQRPGRLADQELAQTFYALCSRAKYSCDCISKRRLFVRSISKLSLPSVYISWIGFSAEMMSFTPES